jgi:hypothetical protein
MSLQEEDEPCLIAGLLNALAIRLSARSPG